MDSRLAELLADRATTGVTAGEAEELSRLLEAAPEVDPSALDLAAAAVHLTAPVPEVAIPPGLEARLEAEAGRFAARLEREETRRQEAQRFEPSRQGGWGARLGWYAAAACLAVAVAGWWPAAEDAAIAVPPPVAPAPPETPPPPTYAQVARSQDALQIPWTATEDPSAAGASGEIVWSTERQQGFMRFAGLEENDPGVFQYQLWIFDAQQDERYPIDGGVFDMENGEVTVPIDAKIGVSEPTLFAVTVEKPGGVVVSSRERIVLIAKVT